MESSLSDIPPAAWVALGLVALVLVLKVLGFAAKVIGFVVIIVAAVAGFLYFTGNLPGLDGTSASAGQFVQGDPGRH